jgi:hypothetical protein
LTRWNLIAQIKNIKTLKLQYPEQDNYPAIPRSRAAILAALIAVLGMLARLPPAV